MLCKVCAGNGFCDIPAGAAIFMKKIKIINTVDMASYEFKNIEDFYLNTETSGITSYINNEYLPA